MPDHSRWYLALTLRERAASLPLEADVARVGDVELARRRLERWMSQTPFQDPARLQDRLASIGLTQEEFLRLLGEASEDVANRVPSPPEWLQDLLDAFALFAEASSVALAVDERKNHAGFLRIVAPLLQLGRTRLSEKAQQIALDWPDAPFDPQAVVGMFFDQISRQVLSIIERAMALELNIARLTGGLTGDTPEERFESFLSAYCQPESALSLLNHYPVLARQIVMFVNNWLDFSVEVLLHLKEDWEQIRRGFCDAETPGMLDEIRSNAGDRHRGGKSVTLLKFSSGPRLVYKPRCLRVDIHFQELLRWLNKYSQECAFKTIKVLDCGEHGWMEFVDSEECGDGQQVSRFYWRVGGYLALLYVLEATDFHFENLIASGEHPIPVDLESLFQHRLSDPKGNLVQTAAHHAVDESVLRVGILPSRIWMNKESEGIDISGLGGQPGQMYPDPVPAWEDSGQDTMHIIKTKKKLYQAQNRPSLRGRDVDVLDYAASIESGFRHVYKLLLDRREELLAHDGLLSKFEDVEVRCILRPTRTYALLLQAGFHPDVLQDALHRDRLFDKLWVGVADTPEVAAVVEDERRDLERGDIPFFTALTSSRDLRNSFGERHVEFFAEPSSSIVRRRLNALSQADLEQQAWFIRASLATVATASHPLRWPERHVPQTEIPADSKRLVKTAEMIGQKLRAIAFLSSDEATWIGLKASSEGYLSLDSLGPDLYSGLSGMTLFFAYLGELSGDVSYTDVSRLTLASVRRQLEGEPSSVSTVGAFGGWGAIIYVFTHLAALWGDSSLIEEAEKIVEFLPELIEKDAEYDVVDGAAGCLAALLCLNSIHPSIATQTAAVLCGDRLLATAHKMDTGIAWPRRLDGACCGGFSHGASGIAWALLRLNELLPDERFLLAAREALAYQSSLFSTELDAWRDLRPSVFEATDGQEEYASVTAWCHGAPGIGLAFARALLRLPDQLVRSQLDTALRITATRGFGGSHCLCHGDLGNLELFLQASKALGDASLARRAQCTANWILEDIDFAGCRCGVSLGVENPGFMNGLAGIGYGLLRLAEPSKVPSVLTLEPPVHK